MRKADAIYFLGYRGEDYYDFNPLMQSYLASAGGSSEVRKFFAVPHLGDENQCSKFFLDQLPSENILIIEDGESWLAKLCEQIAGVEYLPRPSEVHNSVNATQVEEKFLALIECMVVEAAVTPSEEAIKMSRISNQCSSLISDINANILAVWTITEHFRLESIGLGQSEITSFGRPPVGSRFCGIRIGHLLDLQRQYWEFNAKLRTAQEKELGVFNMLLNGAELFRKFHELILTIEQNRNSLTSVIERSVSQLLTGICADYMGLIATRFELYVEMNPEARKLLGIFPTSDELFQRTIKDSSSATKMLGAEAAKFSSVTQDMSSYARGLQKLVGALPWTVIGKENFVKSRKRSLGERITGLNEAIKDRFKELQLELAGGVDSVDFSVPAIAGHLSLRITELCRLVAFGEIQERGQPTFPLPKDRYDTGQLLDEQAERFERCLKVALANSWQKHLRILIGFDTLILRHIYHKDDQAVGLSVSRAKQYASGLNGAETILLQQQTRFQPA